MRTGTVNTRFDQSDAHSADVGLVGPNRAVLPGLVQAARAICGEGGHEFGAGLVAGGSFGGAVRDQAGDRAVFLGVVLAASCPALQGAPLTQFGVCVFDGDPVGGLAALGLPPAVLFGDRSFAEVLRLAGGALTRSGNSWPPVAAAPLAAPGLASRPPPRREFGDKLAKVSP